MSCKTTRFIVAALALTFLCAASGDPPWVETKRARESVTVDFLYETCSAVGQTAHGMIPHFDCESYVYGVLDAHVAVRDALPKAQRACFPASLPPWNQHRPRAGARCERWANGAAANLAMPRHAGTVYQSNCLYHSLEKPRPEA